MKVARNPTAPHTAVIWVTVEVHEKLPSGEMMGNPIRKEKKVFAIEGQDQFICERKLNEFLAETAKTCKQV